MVYPPAPSKAYTLVMSFQAYLDTIKAKTGKTPEELKDLAKDVGIYNPNMKFGVLRDWLKEEFKLGHGHSLAVWAYWKMKGWVHTPK